MKRKFLKFAAWLPAMLLLCIGLSSCYVEVDSDWWDGPPAGWNTINDRRLAGYWVLVQYNSDPVTAINANYLYFNGSGRGRYYYQQNGIKEIESTVYYSQNSNSGTSNYQLNLQYQFSSPLTLNYWFTHNGNTLWMQWRTKAGYVETYVYDRVQSAPW